MQDCSAAILRALPQRQRDSPVAGALKFCRDSEQTLHASVADPFLGHRQDRVLAYGGRSRHAEYHRLSSVAVQRSLEPGRHDHWLTHRAP